MGAIKRGEDPFNIEEIDLVKTNAMSMVLYLCVSDFYSLLGDKCRDYTFLFKTDN